MLTKVLEAKGHGDPKKQTDRQTPTQNVDMPPKGLELINASGAKTCQQKNAY